MPLFHHKNKNQSDMSLHGGIRLITAVHPKSSISELFRAQVEDAVNQFLQNEMTAVLGYEPYARTGQDGQRNYRNGYYNRAFDSTLGNLTVKTPRDRLGLFKNALFEPYANA